MSQPGASTDERLKAKEPEPQQKIPIARSINTLDPDDLWDVIWDALQAHFVYAESGTLHGNINPNAIYMDRTTGRGFLADWEYSTHVVAPGGYVPLCVSTSSLDRWGAPTSKQEIMEKLAKMNAHAQQAQAKEGPEAQSGDQQPKDARQEAPSTIPPSHGHEAENPLVVPAVDRSPKGPGLAG